MKINDLNLRTSPREMDGTNIDIVSTSSVTADASPIVLNSTELIQVKFIPKIVENRNNTAKCLSGKLVYKRKKKNDNQFPTEKISRKSVKTGEFMEIALDTTETLKLYEGIKDLYELSGELKHTPMGSNTFSKVDQNILDLKSVLSNEPVMAKMLMERENIDLVKMLLKIISKSESLGNLRESLKDLNDEKVNGLINSMNLEKLERTLHVLEENIENNHEEKWQRIFTENQWVLSQIFSTPYTFFEEKAYVGGKKIDNSNGNLCDYMYSNSISKNSALIEIKTPVTKLVGKPYRNTFTLTSELSGAINQILNYKDNLVKDYYTLIHQHNDCFEVLNPKCFLIIGNLSSLSKDETKAFENYRNSFTMVEILTFDEIIEKIKNLIMLLSKEE